MKGQNPLKQNLPHPLYYCYMYYAVNSECCFNPIALRMAKTLLSFGHFECSRVNSIRGFLLTVEKNKNCDASINVDMGI